MSQKNSADDWMSRIVGDPAQREREFISASRLEIIFSSLAVILAAVAIWGFTSDAVVGGWVASESIGGVAVLCFAACMAIAANGGIRKRFISLVSTFEARARS